MATDIFVVVLFMLEGTEPLLGASALESFGSGVHLLAERLLTIAPLLR
jgi:hypothetical protein